MDRDILKLDRIIYKDHEYVVIDYEDNGTTIGKGLDFGMKEGFLSARSSLREYLLGLCLVDNKLYGFKRIASAEQGGWKCSEQIFIPYTGCIIIADEGGITEPVSVESFLDSENAFELQFSEGELVRDTDLSSYIIEWDSCKESGERQNKQYFAKKSVDGIYKNLGYNSLIMLTDESDLDFNIAFTRDEEEKEESSFATDEKSETAENVQKFPVNKKYNYRKTKENKPTGLQKREEDSDKKQVNAVEKILAKRLSKLGHSYMDKEDTEHNKRLAFLLCLKAAKLGDKYAMLDLGYCYIHGIGTGKNKKLALKWFQKLAFKGEAVGYLLSYYLLEDESSQLFNISLANHYLESAARLKSSKAMKLLAGNFRIGRGVIKNIGKAKYWYKKAIIHGSEDALLELARLYDHELKDQDNAFDCYLLAAEKENSVAALEVAFRYESGTGTKQNRLSARKWYIKAAGLGNSLAKERLLHLNTDGSDDLDSY